jgi:hypothetical protein
MAKLSKKRKLILFISWVGAIFAGGYYYGRSTSIKWDDEGTAYLYMCHASHWSNSASGPILVMQMRDGTYAFDDQHVREDPNIEAIVREKYPVVGGEEYQHWLDTMVEGIAVAGTTKLAVETYGSRVTKMLEGLSKREWAILTGASAGSFAGGYVLGHRFTENFDAPKFRAALDDDKTWKRVWEFKQKLLQAKANLDTASKNLAALKQVQTGDSGKNAATEKLEEQNKKQYDLIYGFDPDLRNFVPVRQATKQPQP